MTTWMSDARRLTPIMLVAAALVLVAAATAHAWPARPAHARFVDEAKLVNQQDEERIETALSDFVAKHNCDIMVGVFTALPTGDESEACWQIVEAWNLGKGYPEGRYVLLVVYGGDHQPVVKGGKAFDNSELFVFQWNLVHNVIIPRFIAKRYADGLIEGIDAVGLAIDDQFYDKYMALKRQGYNPQKPQERLFLQIIIYGVTLVVVLIVFFGGFSRIFGAFNNPKYYDPTTGIYYEIGIDRRPMKDVFRFLGYRDPEDVKRWYEDVTEGRKPYYGLDEGKDKQPKKDPSEERGREESADVGGGGSGGSW